jgi:hypothetical protein
MIWMGIVVALVAAIVLMAIIVAKRPTHDLGSVSEHWIAEHRLDAP